MELSFGRSVRQIARRWRMGRIEEASSSPTVDPGRVTLTGMLEGRAATDPDGTPFQVRDQSMTFGEWHFAASRAASGLVRLGVVRGNRVGLIFDGLDWLSYAVCYFGLLRAGGTAVHLNATMSAADLEGRLEDCAVTHLIRSSFLPPQRSRVEGRTFGEVMALGQGGTVPHGLEHDIADIRYTSGTTGAPKGYLVPHDNLTFGQTLDGMRELSRSSVMLVPMTLGTSTSATVIIAGLTAGGRMILCSPSEIEEMGSIVATARVDALMLTPHVAEQIIEAELERRHDLSSVRLVALASSPLFPVLSRRLLAAMSGVRVQLACAQSEASPALLVHTYDPARPFSIGRPARSTEVRIVGPDGTDVATGDVGEIWLRHAAPKRLMLGQPDFNKKLEADGWYRTGDLGRWNEAEEVDFFDRKVDVLRHGTSLVSSLAVESSLAEHPAVREVAVVSPGVVSPGSENGPIDEIVAFVTLRSPVTPKELAEHAAANLPAESRPHRFVITTAIPRTQNGKISKRALRLRGVTDTSWWPHDWPERVEAPTVSVDNQNILVA